MCDLFKCCSYTPQLACLHLVVILANVAVFFLLQPFRVKGGLQQIGPPSTSLWPPASLASKTGARETMLAPKTVFPKPGQDFAKIKHPRTCLTSRS